MSQATLPRLGENTPLPSSHEMNVTSSLPVTSRDLIEARAQIGFNVPRLRTILYESQEYVNDIDQIVSVLSKEPILTKTDR